MKHEFKQGDEVEVIFGHKQEWYKAEYICFHKDHHLVYFGCGYIKFNDYEIRPIKKPWRAGIGKPYFYVLSQGDYVDSVERNDSVDDERYNIGNYFRTGKQAEQAAELIKQTLKKFHDENTNTANP